MAVAVQSGYPVTNTSASTRASITQALTIAAGAGNRLLVVFTFHEDAAGAVTGITWNGTALTKLDSSAATTWSHVEAWYLKAPATGSFNLVASKTGAVHWGLSAYVLEGVDQTTTFRTVAKGSADTGTSTSHTVPSWTSGDYLLDALSIDGTGHTAAVGANQTKDWGTLDFGIGSNENQGSSQTTTDGVMSWTWTTSAPNSHLAIGVIPAAGGGSPQSVSVTGLGSASAFGALKVNMSIGIVGLSSAASFGAVTALPGARTVPVSGKGSAAQFGTITPVPGNVNVLITGRGSAAAFGAVTVTGGNTVNVSGLGSAAAFGTLTIITGSVTISVPGRASAAQFGAPVVSGGSGPTFDPATHGGKHY